MPRELGGAPSATSLTTKDLFPRSPALPLLQPSLSHFAAEYACRSTGDALAVGQPSFHGVLWAAAEAARRLPQIEKPGEKGGDGRYVERTLFDAFLPLNTTLSTVRLSPLVHSCALALPFALSAGRHGRSAAAQGIAFLNASATELVRTNKIQDLVTYLAGPAPEAEPDAEPEIEPEVLPWEWDRVAHDTSANFARDVGSQTLARLFERRFKAEIGSGAAYCELLKHAHKAACALRRDPNEPARGPMRARSEPLGVAMVALARRCIEYFEYPRGWSASMQAAKVIIRSPIFYAVRGLTMWLADVAVDAVAWYRGQLRTAQLQSNAALKLAKFSLSGVLCLSMGSLVPFVYPHYLVFMAVEQLGANMLADFLVAKLGTIEPA